MGHGLPRRLAHVTLQLCEAGEGEGTDDLAVALGAGGRHLAQHGRHCRLQYRERSRHSQRPTVGVVPRVEVSGLGLLDGAALIIIVTLGACSRDGRQSAAANGHPIRKRGHT